MKKIILLSLLLLCFITESQTVREFDDFVISPTNDFYSNNYLFGSNTGKGNTGIGSENDFSAALLNPAAFKLNKKFSVFLQYSYKTNNTVTYNNVYGSNSYQLIHKPNSFSGGLALKLNKYLNCGVFYSNINNLKYKFDNVISSSENYSLNLNIHSFVLPVNLRFGKFGIGVNLFYNLYRDDITGATTIVEPNTPHDITDSFERFNFQVGLFFKPVNTFSAGLTFTPGFKSDINHSESYSISPFFKFISTNPFKVTAGVNFLTLSNKLGISFDYNFRRTSEITGYIDKNDINFGVEYFLNKNVTLRSGFFTIFDIRDFHNPEVGFPGSEGDFSQYFLTGGFTYNFNNVDISLSLMDSHISPGKIKLFQANSTVIFNF